MSLTQQGFLLITKDTVERINCGHLVDLVDSLDKVIRDEGSIRARGAKKCLLSGLDKADNNIDIFTWYILDLEVPKFQLEGINCCLG